MGANWDGVREVEKLIYRTFGTEIEEGLDHVNLAVTQTEIGVDLLSESIELLPVEVLAVKGKVPGKKPKSIPGNSLKRYFCSSRNVDNPGTLWMPKKTSTASSDGLIPMSSVASSSRSNPAIELLSASPRSNVAVKLVCPGGLPDLAPPPKELEEVINLDAEDEPAKKKKKNYESHRKFQDSWAAKTPWAEMIVGADGEYQSVKCIICSVVTGRVKQLAPKLDTISKHAGRRKAKKDLPHLGVKEGEFYFSENCKHAANTRLYKTRSKDSVELLVVKGMKGERRRKRIQFALIFHLLAQGRPMLEYEACQSLFKFLLVPGLPKLHWSDNAGWEMADAMLKQVLKQNRVVMQSSKFLSLSCDEVTTIDNQSWISIHVYYISEWRRIPLLVGLERVDVSPSAVNLTSMLISNLEKTGGLSREQVGSMLVSFGADGASVFQGVRNGVTKKIQESIAPFLEGIHCMAHRTNLAVSHLSKLPVVCQIESLLSSLHKYFSHSPKKHVEFVKLAALMQTKGNKIQRNIKTRWISMLSPAQRVIDEYKTLIMKMAEDSYKHKDAEFNWESMCNVQVVLGLTCLLPLLVAVHSLIKFAQGRDVYVCDYVAAVKQCQLQLYKLYLDPATRFDTTAFWDFTSILDCVHPTVSMRWQAPFLDLNGTNIDHLAFFTKADSWWATHPHPITGKPEMVTKEILADIVEAVKASCVDAAQALTKELTARFPASTLMDALGFCYPQYWLQKDSSTELDPETTFPIHLSIVKAQYAVDREVKESDGVVKVIPALLSTRTLDMQSSLFKVTMQSNAAAALQQPFDTNPFTRIWRSVTANALLRRELSEFIKLAEIAAVHVLGSVEDERTFSTLSFMKTKLRNRLQDHLPTVVGMYSQSHFTMQNFLYDSTFDDWYSVKNRQVEADEISSM